MLYKYDISILLPYYIPWYDLYTNTTMVVTPQVVSYMTFVVKYTLDHLNQSSIEPLHNTIRLQAIWCSELLLNVFCFAIALESLKKGTHCHYPFECIWFSFLSSFPPWLGNPWRLTNILIFLYKLAPHHAGFIISESHEKIEPIPLKLFSSNHTNLCLTSKELCAISCGLLFGRDFYIICH